MLSSAMCEYVFERIIPMKDSKRRLLAGLLATVLLLGSISSALAEGAVEEEEEPLWYAASLTYMEELGYLDCLASDTLDPDALTSRSTLVCLLADIAGVVPEEEQYQTDPFPDVSAQSWYGTAVSWAAECGIVSGDEWGNFNPDDSITKEQLAIVLYQYLQYTEVTLPTVSNLTPFADRALVSSWAEEAVDYLQEVGILMGDDFGLLSPQETVTNAQVITLLCRMVQTLSALNLSNTMVTLAREQLEEYGDGAYSGEVYRTWSGTDEEEWSSTFVFWCANSLGLSASNSIFSGSVTTAEELWTWFSEAGQTHLRGEGYTPQPGDLIFYYSRKTNSISHVGIVERYDAQTNTVYTIEGDAKNDCLGTHAFTWEPDNEDATYPNRGTYICGFATVDYSCLDNPGSFTGTTAYDVADYIYEVLLYNGYTSAAACGILGNMYQESRFDYTLDNAAVGTGLCQWIDVRRDNLLSYCEANGYDYLTVEGQLAFLLEYDLALQECFFWSLGGLSTRSYPLLTDVETAAYLFFICFERPGSAYVDGMGTPRIEIAKQFYARYNDGYTGTIGDLG